MKGITDLPNDVLDYILIRLGQEDLISLNLTCRDFYTICNKRLYANIYITNKTTRERKDEKKNAYLWNWTVLKSSLSPDRSSLKKFEGSLNFNRELASYIQEIITDDVSFILFKLKFWYKKYFSATNNLKKVYFGNIPLSQLNIAYEDLYNFYKLPGINVTTLQLKNLSDLLAISESLKVITVKSLNFHLLDIKDVENENIALLERQKQKLLEIFENVNELNIVSVHDLALRFIKFLTKLLNTEAIFKNLKRFSMNHNHGQMNNQFNFSSMYPLEKEMELDFQIIQDAIDVSKIESLTLKIDCNHIYCPISGSDMHFTMSDNIEYCNCLERFFCQFKSAKLQMLSNLSLTRLGQSAINNPFSLFYFKAHLKSLLVSMRQLLSLELDTNAQLYPFHSIRDGSQVNILKEVFLLQNEKLVKSLKHTNLKRLVILDYIESFHFWDLNSIDFSSQKLNQECQCHICDDIEKNIIAFIDTNRQIQFYLSPITTKNFAEYYFDLLLLILLFCRTNTVPESIPSMSAFSSAQKNDKLKLLTNIVPSATPIMSALHQQTLDLHGCFKHADYKELINYKYVKSLLSSSNDSFEIMCDCDGSEFSRYLTFLHHQISPLANARFASDPGSIVHLNLNNIYFGTVDNNRLLQSSDK